MTGAARRPARSASPSGVGDLPAAAHRHHAELVRAVVGLATRSRTSVAVALLEDVQRQHQAGKQHRAQREDRAAARSRCERIGPVAVRAHPVAGDLRSSVAQKRRRLTVPLPGPAPGGLSDRPPRLGRVLNRIDLRGSRRDPRGLLPRAQLDVSAAVETIRPVVEAVREHGFSAIREATERFDGVALERLRVPAEAIAAAAEALDPDVRAALLEAIARARKVHADQRRTDVTTQVVPGGTVTERWVPVARVGLYVPGGLAVYPSTVVMNVVPAQVAGVESLVVASPPQPENGGLPDARVLAACALLGVDEVYAVGGAQAIAMLGYGSRRRRRRPTAASRST